MSCILFADWLPDDTPWDKLRWPTKDDLKKQCAKRYLPVSGTKFVLRQRLLDYQRTHTTEVRPCPLRLEVSFPWRSDYGCSIKPILPIVLVEDLSTFRVCFKMRFTFATHRITNHKGDTETFARVQVDFTNKPSCSCGRHFLQDFPCLHVEYLLRKIFNTSELLLWQEAYLTSELEHIYKKSHAALSRVKPDRYRQGKQCVICFAVHKTHELNVPCSLCGLPTHPFCLKALRKKRQYDPTQASQCLLCLDKTALAVEKYFGQSQVSPAVAIPVPVSVAPASIRAPAGSDRSITGAIQSEAVSLDSIERTTTLQEPHSAAQQRCTSTPLPGVPALIWQEMHQQAREQKEQQQQKQSEQRQRQDEQEHKQQRQQQQQQAKVRAIRPVITEVRVSELPGPARVEVGSRVAAKQTPIVKKPVSKELGGSVGLGSAAAMAVGEEPRNPLPPPAPDAASQAVTPPPAASGSGVSSGVRSPIQSSPPAISTATQADESAVNPPGGSRGRSTDAPEGSADVASDEANTTDVPGSALIGANTIITATFGDTNNNNSNKTDRKAAKLAQNLKRLEAKLEQLDRDADYYYTKAERKSQKYQTIQKKIRKIKEKAEKRALARRREGVDEGIE